VCGTDTGTGARTVILFPSSFSVISKVFPAALWQVTLEAFSLLLFSKDSQQSISFL
jgi:hypothetical protein